MKDQHSLKNILSLLMSECDIDDASLAKQTGIPVSTLSRLRTSSDCNPTAHTLRPIAKFFDVTIDQLLGDEPLSPDRLPGTYLPEPYISANLPILEWEWIDAWKNSSTEVPLKNWVSTERKLSENAFALVVNTDTLGLLFRKGSLLIIEPEKSPNDGDLIILKASNDDPIVLKQILKDGNEKYIKSINPDIHGVKLLPENAICYGVVIEIRYSIVEKENSNSSPSSSKELADAPYNFRLGKLSRI